MRLIDGVRIADKTMDIIPVVSTIKNACIILYRNVHKVAIDTLNVKPEDASAWDDVKITMLSKNCFWTWAFTVPVLGNIAALVKHLRDYLYKTDFSLDNSAKGTVGTIIQDPYNTHKVEVARLYFAKNPQCALGKILNNLERAIDANNEEMVPLLLNAYRGNVANPDHTARLQNCVIAAANSNNPNIFKAVLEKYIELHPDEKEALLEKCLVWTSLCPHKKSEKDPSSKTVVPAEAEILKIILDKKTTQFSDKIMEKITREIKGHQSERKNSHRHAYPLSLLLASDKFVLTQEQARTLLVTMIEGYMYTGAKNSNSSTIAYSVPETFSKQFGSHIDENTIRECFRIFLRTNTIVNPAGGKTTIERMHHLDIRAIESLYNCHANLVTNELLLDFLARNDEYIFRLHPFFLPFFIDKIPDTVEGMMLVGVSAVLNPLSPNDSSKSVISLLSKEYCGEFVTQQVIHFALKVIIERHASAKPPTGNKANDDGQPALFGKYKSLEQLQHDHLLDDIRNNDYQWKRRFYENAAVEVLKTYKNEFDLKQAAKLAQENNAEIYALFVKEGIQVAN